MSKHTPGTWIARPDPNSWSKDDWVVGFDEQIDQIAVCSERDARLIAAAPDLLKALKAIVSIDGHSALTEAEADAIHARARAAIAKAEGA